jgi:hypothetical protein
MVHSAKVRSSSIFSRGISRRPRDEHAALAAENSTSRRFSKPSKPGAGSTSLIIASTPMLQGLLLAYSLQARRCVLCLGVPWQENFAGSVLSTRQPRRLPVCNPALNLRLQKGYQEGAFRHCREAETLSAYANVCKCLKTTVLSNTKYITASKGRKPCNQMLLSRQPSSNNIQPCPNRVPNGLISQSEYMSPRICLYNLRCCKQESGT